MKRSPTLFVFVPLVLAALACTLTKPTGAELAPQLPSPTMAPVPPSTTPTATKAVKLTGNTPTPTNTPSPLYCVVNSEALNIRSCAGISCPVIAWATQGARLQLLTTGPWAMTDRGWINTQFCEEIP